MQFLKRAALAALAAATLSTGPAYAAPVQSPVAADGSIVQVRGCHRDVQRHRVPEFGNRRAWHYHRGRRCRPVEVNRPGPVPLPQPVRDCHREPRRHYVPGLGSVVHRHRGPSCRVQVLRRYERPRADGFCVRIEGFSFCAD